MSAAGARSFGQPMLESLEHRTHLSAAHPAIGAGITLRIPARVNLTGGIAAGRLASNLTNGRDGTFGGDIERIHWGDGTSAVGTALFGFDKGVLFPADLPQGGHTYSHFGQYKITIELENLQGTVTDVIRDTAVVTRNLTAGRILRATKAAPISNKLIGIYDNRLESFSSASTFTVDWGDGTAPSTATVVERGQLTLIYASHQYASAGAYHTSVIRFDPGTQPISAQPGFASSQVFSPAVTETIVTGKAIVIRQ